MSFLAPERLWLLAVPAALAIGYAVLQVRRSAYALRFTNLDLLDRVAPDRAGWRRHLAALGLVAALVLLSLAVARPTRAEQVPQELATVVLALDTSLSMEATDVEPSRLAAAQEAAREFVAAVPPDVRVGLVSFAGETRALAAPTTDRAPLLAAIDRLELGPGTAIGEAIFTSLDLIATSAAAGREGGEEIPASVVVLSDGETTVGRPDSEAAAAAAEALVPVATVAFGTDAGTVVVDGEVIPVPVNEEALADVAAATGGTFFEAGTADELLTIFDQLGSAVGFTTEEREVTDWFAGAGLALAALAGLGSLAWFSRLP